MNRFPGFFNGSLPISRDAFTSRKGVKTDMLDPPLFLIWPSQITVAFSLPEIQNSRHDLDLILQRKQWLTIWFKQLSRTIFSCQRICGLPIEWNWSWDNESLVWIWHNCWNQNDWIGNDSEYWWCVGTQGKYFCSSEQNYFAQIMRGLCWEMLSAIYQE